MQDLKKQVAENPEKFERIISRVEIAGLITTLLAVFLLREKMSTGSTLLIVGLSILSGVYIVLLNIPQIFRLQPGNSFTIAVQVGYFGLGATMMGILFSWEGWSGNSILLYGGCAVTAVMFLYFTYKMYFGELEDESHRVIINNLVVRMLPALLTAGVLVALYFKSKNSL